MVNDLCNDLVMRSAKSPTPSVRHRGDEPHLLREVMRTHQALMVTFSQTVGMPASRLALMRLLAVSGEDLGVMDMARRLAINPAAVSRLLRTMEREGLVRRRAHPRDGRRATVTLSPAGLRLFEEIHERTHQLERTLATVIRPDEMKAAAEVLVRLRDAVAELPPLESR